MNAQQIRVDTPADITATFYPAGAAQATDDGTVTVVVKRADGTTVSGVGAVSGTGGSYTATLPAQTSLDILTATWSGASAKVRTVHEIIGEYIVELADIRATLNIADAGKFPVDRLEDARSWFTDLAADALNYSPVPRFAHETLDGTGISTIALQAGHAYVRTLRYVKVDGTAVDAGELAGWDFNDTLLNRSRIGGTFALGHHNVEVGYEHGLDYPSAELRQLALVAIRFRLLTNQAGQIPDRALSITNDYGNIQMAQAGPRRPTGIPDVDTGLMRLRLPVMA